MSELAATKPVWLARLLPEYAGNRQLLLYVFGVFGVGITLLFTHEGSTTSLVTVPFLAWFLFNFFAEFLWLETGTGEGTDSMAMTMNFAVIMLFDPALYLWVIGVSVLLATRFIQKRDWFRALFGLGQMVITAFVAGMLFRAIQGGPTFDLDVTSVRQITASILCGAAYFFCNTFLVAGAVSLERKLPFWTTWSQNWGYRNSIVSSIALFSLAPILILAYLSIGYAGVFLFFLPLLIIKNQNREYINLQKATNQIVSTERMAAKGEMAAQVAHEINNYLAILNGRAQLLIARAGRVGDDAMQGDAEVIRQQVSHMSTLAKGLLEFSHKGIRIQRFDLNEQVIAWVDFVRPQNSFDGVTLDCELQPDLGEVEADGGALQQVLINLLKNAAEAICDQEDRSEDEPARILVRTSKTRKDRILIQVIDNGPGMTAAVQAKIFEPAFTTKRHGHGFGLSTCYKIMQNHQGGLSVQSEVGQGTEFLIELPRRAKTAGASAVTASEPDRKVDRSQSGSDTSSDTGVDADVNSDSKSRHITKTKSETNSETESETESDTVSGDAQTAPGVEPESPQEPSNASPPAAKGDALAKSAELKRRLARKLNGKTEPENKSEFPERGAA